MHLPDIHASEALMAAVIAGLTTLVGVQLRVILGMVKQTRIAADEQQGRLHELGQRLDEANARADAANEKRHASASRSRARLEEMVGRYHRLVEALGGGEGGLT